MKDKDFTKFRDFYRPLMPTIKAVGFSGQLISGATMIFGVCMIIYAKLSCYHISVIMLSMLIIGGAAAVLIEGGQRKILPFVVRQLMQWNFANWFWRGMFFVLFLVSISLMVASALLSWNASPELVEIASDGPEQHDMGHLASSFSSEQKQIMNDYDKQQASIEKASKDEIKAISATYDEKIRARLKQARDKVKGHEWIVSSVIPGLKASKKEKIAAINRKKAEQTTALNTSRQAAISSVQTNKATVLNVAATQNMDNVDRLRRSNRKWGMFLAGLTLLGLMVFVFSVVIQEMYAEGSRDKRTVSPEPAMIPIASHDNRPRNIKTDNVNKNTVKADITTVITVPCQGFNNGKPLTKRQLKQRLGTYTKRRDEAKNVNTRERNNVKVQLLNNAIKKIEFLESQK